MTKLQVESFLNKLRSIDASTIIIAGQKKTRDYMVRMDFDRQDVIEKVLSLKVADYSTGPTPNDWQTGDVWIFGIMVQSELIYVKLSISGKRPDYKMLCMSFHPSEHTMKFPYDPSI